MRKHFIHITLAMLILSSSLLFSQCSNYTPTEKDQPIETLTELATVYPKAAYVELTETATYIVKDKSGKAIGTVLLSSPYSDDIKGFNGPTPLQIALDKSGKILEVRVLDNNETPNFLKRVTSSEFMNSWNGMTVKEALAKEVDAVSGATFSSNSIQKSLKARLSAVK
ncbi:MAG: FMN-binding protein [Bacteroidales bacterium]|nr:FMN-binding protein [Bacteroidales bacterium]